MYTASGSANVVLYVGLGMICIGLVITFVGLGDKGFKTLELKLIGPSLVGCGVFFALLRILFCTLPSCCKGCMRCCKKKQEDKEQLMKEHPHSAMTGDNVVSINIQLHYSLTRLIIKYNRFFSVFNLIFCHFVGKSAPKASIRFTSHKQQ